MRSLIQTGSRPIPRRPAKTAVEGRVCAEDGCTAKLSIYNQRPRCHQHWRRKYPRTRGTAV